MASTGSTGVAVAATPVRLPDFALDGRDRMLERAVVELHHVLAFGTFADQAAGQVDQHDVESARAQPEVERLGVDHDLVSDVAGSDQILVCPGGTVLFADPDLERTRGHDGPAPQLQHLAAASTRICSQISSISPRFSRGTHSSWVWFS